MLHDDDLSARILLDLASLGFRARIVPVECLGDLEGDIEELLEQGLLGEEFRRQYIPKFVFSVPDELREARSIIAVTAPHAALKAAFTLNGQPFETIVPPTYTDDTDWQAHDCIREALEPEGYRLVTASLPKKLLAVRCGLGDYGKNNIVYAEGLGSYHRLVAFYTDAPLSYGEWGESRMLERCQKCEACIKKCPSGAIFTDRFLVDAERCITFYNEATGPFPDWVEPAWHTCLVGCMACQDVCPENKPFRKKFEHVAVFTQEETEMLLGRPTEEDFSEATLGKLRRIGMHEDYHLIGRNLEVLSGQRQSGM
jgi:epoxyqueuosine reductase